MFHGIEVSRHLGRSNFLDGEEHLPLRLARTGRIVPEVFKPGCSLVVSADVKARLSGVPNVEFLKVTFEKLVDFYYQAGDDSYYEKWWRGGAPRSLDPERLLLRLPDFPALHETIGDYYEMLINRISRIGKRYDDNRTIILHDKYGGDRDTIEVSRSMFSDYPILWWGYIFITEPVFRIIEPDLDFDYFKMATINLEELPSDEPVEIEVCYR